MNAPVDFPALKVRQQAAWAQRRLRRDRHDTADRRRIARRGLRPQIRRARPRRRGRQRQCDARRGAPWLRGDVDRLRVDAARPGRRSGASRAPRREVPGCRRRGAAVRRRELRRGAVDVRRDVRARPRDRGGAKWRACAGPADGSGLPTGHRRDSSASCSRRSAAMCRRPPACSRRRCGARKRTCDRCSASKPPPSR